MRFAGELNLLGRGVSERTIYGRTTIELWEGEKFSSIGCKPLLTGGLLVPTEGAIRHATLSAVL